MGFLTNLVFTGVLLCHVVLAQYHHRDEERPQPQTYSKSKIEFSCHGLKDGNYPDPRGSPTHCSQIYYSCVHGEALKSDCPQGLFFDPDNNWCESMENIVVCGGQHPTTMPPADAPILHYSQFDCSDRGDGFFPNPKEHCSRTYYACSGGLAQELSCPDGLVYDPEESVCNVLELTFVCTGVRITTRATEPPRMTYAPPHYPVDCHGMEDGPHPDPTEKCSHVFYVCSNERTTMETCPGNTYFNPEKLLCDNWVNIFDCSGKPPPPPADAPVTLPAKHVDFDCSNMQDGPYPDPKTHCSITYYVCFHGIANELTCPTNTYWDPDELICDGFGNIYACTGMKKAPTTERPIIELVTSPPRIPEFPCSEHQDGFYSDPTNQCSNMYFVCSKKMDNKMFCPEGLYFDVETEMCDRWANVYACSGNRAIPTTQPPKRDPVTEKVPFDCHGLEDGDYADPTKTCSHIYYSCSGGVATKRECSENTYFDQEIDLCETFDNVPECSGTYRKMTSTLPPRDIEIYPFKCEHKPDGNYPVADCEGYYWSCVGGVTLKIDCPLGLKYDIEMNQCDWHYHIPKCGGQRVTYPQHDDTQKPNYPLDCVNLADGSYPDPESACSQTFYVCHAGQTNKLDCPAGLFFNPDENRCELKVKISHCGGSAPDLDEPSTYNRPVSHTMTKDVSARLHAVKHVPSPMMLRHDEHDSMNIEHKLLKTPKRLHEHTELERRRLPISPSRFEARRDEVVEHPTEVEAEENLFAEELPHDSSSYSSYH